MADVILLRRTPLSMVPADALAEEALARVKVGEVVQATIRRPRNLLHHRKFFALLQAVFPHQSQYPTLDHLRDAITIALGHCDTLRLLDGRTVTRAKSISFAAMDQSAFEQFFDRAVVLIVEHVLPHIRSEDLLREVDDILLGNLAAHDHRRSLRGGR